MLMERPDRTSSTGEPVAASIARESRLTRDIGKCHVSHDSSWEEGVCSFTRA